MVFHNIFLLPLLCLLLIIKYCAGDEDVDYNMPPARSIGGLGNGAGPGGPRNSTQVTIPKDVSILLWKSSDSLWSKAHIYRRILRM